MADGSQLLVLVSILNGLALARLFEHLGKYFYLRDRVRMDLLVPAWAGLTFLFIVRNWWGYAQVGFDGLSYWEYLYRLETPLLVYLLAVLLTPELPGEGKLDLGEHYFRVSRWLFGILLTIFVSGQVHRLVFTDGELLTVPNTIRLLFIALVVAVGWTRRRSAHVAFCLLALVLYLAFVMING